MPSTRQDETSVRTGALLILFVAGAIPIVVSAFHGTHWTTYARWYALPTALMVAGRFFFGWFRSLVWRVAGAGALYLVVAAVCSAAIAWWNWMVFTAVAVLGALLIVLLGRHALALLVALGAAGVTWLKRAWARWQSGRRRDRPDGKTDTAPEPGSSLSSGERIVPEEEGDEPDSGDEASGDRKSDTPDGGHAPRSRLGRLAGTPSHE